MFQKCYKPRCNGKTLHTRSSFARSNFGHVSLFFSGENINRELFHFWTGRLSTTSYRAYSLARLKFSSQFLNFGVQMQLTAIEVSHIFFNNKRYSKNNRDLFLLMYIVIIEKHFFTIVKWDCENSYLVRIL